MPTELAASVTLNFKNYIIISTNVIPSLDSNFKGALINVGWRNQLFIFVLLSNKTEAS